MRFYELAYLISNNEAKPNEVYQEINKFIEKEGGKIEKTSPLNEVDLAHPIRKEAKAALASVDFYIEPNKLKGIKEKIKSLSSSNRTKQNKSPLLRALIIRKEVPRKEPINQRKTTKTKLINKEKVNTKTKSKKNKKVELKEINQKIEEILKE